MSKSSRKGKVFQCTNCGEDTYKAPADIKKSKHGNFFCSKECLHKQQSVRGKKKLENKLGIDDLKKWLEIKYHKEKLGARDIALLMYGRRTHSPNVLGWMKKLNIPTRERSDAVALQWKDNPKRREQQAKWAEKTFGDGTTARDKIIKIMQTEEYKEKQRISKTGERNGMYGITGANHPNWNPDITDEQRMDERKYPEYVKWRKEVYERDNYTCQKCKSKRGGDLVAHHINGYHWDEVSRTEIDNGVTLCEKCHKEFHATYGYRHNDLFQFAQFMDLTLTK